MAGKVVAQSNQTLTTMNVRTNAATPGELVRREIMTRLAKLKEAARRPDPAYKPAHNQYPRRWVRPEAVPLTTIATRRERFRVMSWNLLTDCYTQHKLRWADQTTTPFSATPFSVVEPRMTEDDMSWNSRCPMICDEILSYDPDIVMINEINKYNFDKSMWRMMRANGYGCFYTSARLKKAATKTQADDPTVGHHWGRIPYEEDVGNAIYFHKGRFVPLVCPGYDGSPRRIPYINMTGLRDKVTGMNLLACTVFFTVGHDKAAIAAREQEARGMLKLINAFTADSKDRSHTAVFIAGDFNNIDYHEPCVSLIADEYMSAYDLVGGPKWTTWYHTDKETPWVDARHRDPTWALRNHNRHALENKDLLDNIQKRMLERVEERKQLGATRTEFLQETQRIRNGEENGESNLGEAITVTEKYHEMLKNKNANHLSTLEAPNANSSSGKDVVKSETLGFNFNPTSLSQTGTITRAEDKNQVVPESVHLMQTEGIVKRTSDFMFFDSKVLSALSVLDVPREEDIEKETLLPNKRLPSHHVPLVAEFAWNTFDPKQNPRRGG